MSDATVQREDLLAAVYSAVGRLLEQTHKLVVEVEQLKLSVRDLMKPPTDEQ